MHNKENTKEAEEILIRISKEMERQGKKTGRTGEISGSSSRNIHKLEIGQKP